MSKDEDSAGEENLNFIKKDNLSVNLHFGKEVISNFRLPLEINEFKDNFRKLFGIDEKKKSDNEIAIFYTYAKEENEEKEIEVKNSSDYMIMIKRISQSESKDPSNVIVETSKYPPGVGREEPDNFEKEIKLVVERQLKIAEENILKSLLGNKTCYGSNIKQNYNCNKCNQAIVGDMYKDILADEEGYLCEKCSKTITTPVFIINQIDKKE